MAHKTILPEGWPTPKGYSNGILAERGNVLFIAGQVGWTDKEEFASEKLVPQFEQTLKNILTIVHQAGGVAGDICRMTCFCSDREQYLSSRRELGEIWKKIMGRHYPCMSMIFVVDLLDHPAVIEIEATAVIADQSER